MTVKTKNSRKNRDLPEIVPVSDIDEPFSTVLYGLPGSGKTTLAATWPKPLLLIDIRDKGTKSVADVKGVDVARIKSIAQLEATYWALKRGELDYATVALDTVTQLQQMYVVDLTGKDEAMKWGGMTRKQFGAVSHEMKEMITNFRDLEDINTLFLAQQRFFNVSDDDEDLSEDAIAEIGPALFPSVATTMNADVSIIGQCFIRRHVVTKKVGKKIEKRESLQYCLRLAPDGVRAAKIRKPRRQVLPSFLIDPTYEDLIDIMNGEENGKK